MKIAVKIVNRWMEKVKNIWSDFPVYETQRRTTKSKNWFSSMSSCADDNLILDEGKHFLMIITQL